MAKRNVIPATVDVGPEPTNGGEHDVESRNPYRAQFTLRGDVDLLFHRWNCEAVAEKAAAAKGSKAKKSDNTESYVYRNDKNELCIPGEYPRQAVIHAAKFMQDPRSPRKSMMDLTKAAVQSLTDLASLGVDKWHYDHQCRVQVQRAAITRTRPGIRAGWEATFIFLVTLPEYVSPAKLQELLSSAGRLIGIGDFRPTYGRFQVARFEVLP